MTDRAYIINEGKIFADGDAGGAWDGIAEVKRIYLGREVFDGLGAIRLGEVPVGQMVIVLTQARSYGSGLQPSMLWATATLAFGQCWNMVAPLALRPSDMIAIAVMPVAKGLPEQN